LTPKLSEELLLQSTRPRDDFKSRKKRCEKQAIQIQRTSLSSTHV